MKVTLDFSDEKSMEAKLAYSMVIFKALSEGLPETLAWIKEHGEDEKKKDDEKE